MKSIRSITYLATALFCIGLLPACKTVPASHSLGFDHYAIHVSDLAKSASFYEALGLRRIPDPFKDDRHVWLGVGPRQELHLIAGRTEPFEPNIDVHLALRARDLSEVTAMLKKLDVAYYDGERRPNLINKRPDGVGQIYLQDPDGYWIEINDVAP